MKIELYKEYNAPMCFYVDGELVEITDVSSPTDGTYDITFKTDKQETQDIDYEEVKPKLLK